MDKQTAKFISKIAENLPDLSPKVMSGWIENPRNLQNVLAPLVLGPNTRKFTVHILNLDDEPFVPEGWIAEIHHPGGQFAFDTSELKLRLDSGQENGKSVQGHDLRKRLEKEPVMNAVLLDWFLANPQYIPEEWKGKYVFFWGTVYRDGRGLLYVRYLYWDCGQWHGGNVHLDLDWTAGHPALVRASPPS